MQAEKQKNGWRLWLPQSLVILWLVFLGVTIWLHALQSQQPPLYDALSYWHKGINFWFHWHQGMVFNPLNIEPIVRPPGTVLLTQPFAGGSVAGFYFRSVFLPVVCLVIAVYMAASGRMIGQNRAVVATLAIFFSVIPMFYHFEAVFTATENIPNGLWWGFVDNFQGGVAALAAAAVLRSLATAALPLLAAGWLLAACTILIKPSGAVVMLLLALAWLLLLGLLLIRSEKHGSACQTIRRYGLVGAAQGVLVYGVVTAVCVFSRYFSAENFDYAGRVLAVAKGVLVLPSAEIVPLLHQSLGWPVLIWLAVLSSIAVVSRRTPVQGNWRLGYMLPTDFLLAASFIWLGGLWYWLVMQQGGNQIRYFTPFFFMGLILILPVAGNLWQQQRGLRHLFVAMTVLLAVNLSLLLLQPQPPQEWQQASGVYVSLGATDREAKAAYQFLTKVRQDGKPVQVYSFWAGAGASTFENVGAYAGIMQPQLPTFSTRLPLDWEHGFVVRLSELVASQYILFQPVRQSEAQLEALQPLHIDSFAAENSIFQAWLTGLTAQDGIQLVVDSPQLQLYAIADRQQFQKSLQQFVDAHAWRPAFMDANAGF